MATKKKPTYPGKCDVCGMEFTTNDEVFMHKNGDDWIICKDEECYKKQGGVMPETKQSGGKFQSSKFKLETVPAIRDVVEGLIEEFYKKRTGFEKQRLDLDQEAVMFESLFRTVSGNFKP